jgi:endonuclease III
MNKKALALSTIAARQAKYAPIAAALAEMYGPIDWRRGLPPLDELVDCILSQSTTDANRDRAFDAIKARYGDDWGAVMNAPLPELTDTIRPAGLANQKAARIQDVLRTIQAERGVLNIDFLAEMPINEAKAWLTALNGVGPKTAAIVLCFAFNREAFPVDTHVHRLGQRIGFLTAGITADDAHDVMEAIVPPTAYYAFHIHLITHGRRICTARSPQCPRCPIQQHCDYFSSQQRSPAP